METIVRSVTEINAPAEQVWQTLLNFRAYPEWNTFTERVEATPGVMDSDVVMKVRLFRLFAQPQTEQLCEFTPSRRRIAWGATFGTLEMGRARRTQEIVSVGPNRCRYITEDMIGGRLQGFIIRYFGGAMQRGFDRVGAGLKARCE